MAKQFCGDMTDDVFAEKATRVPRVYNNIMFPNYESTADTWGAVLSLTMPSAGVYIVQISTSWLGYAGENNVYLEGYTRDMALNDSNSARFFTFTYIVTATKNQVIRLMMKLPRTMTYEASSDNYVRYVKVSN